MLFPQNKNCYDRAAVISSLNLTYVKVNNKNRLPREICGKLINMTPERRPLLCLKKYNLFANNLSAI